MSLYTPIAVCYDGMKALVRIDRQKFGMKWNRNV
jgi:hypothetical protein